MAENKENVQPSTCTSTKPRHKKNKLKLPQKNNVGLPFNPKDTQNISEIIEIKENIQFQPSTSEQSDYELVTESDVADAVLDIMDVSKLPPSIQEIASQLDDQDYVSTRRSKRKSEYDDDGEETCQKKRKTLFQKVSQLLIEEIDEVESITTCNSEGKKWITVNFK